MIAYSARWRFGMNILQFLAAPGKVNIVESIEKKDIAPTKKIQNVFW